MSEIILTIQQEAAIDMVKKYSISILTGGPGTGKTTTTLKIIQWAQTEKLHIAQAAPTGKAAKRMMDATKHYASTIHALLGCEHINGKFQFIHGKNKPLPCDLLIIDEISMITNDLMCRVMEAVDPRKTKVLFIGDQDQLPSVGPGAVLRDLLASKIIPHTELDIVQRNSGTIVSACHKIKQGILYSPPTILDLEAESPVNLIHVECGTPEKTLAGIEAIFCDRMPLRGYDPINDVQVISPVNEKGLLSCKSINEQLRDRLNPKAWDAGDYPLRVGDKVINTKNTEYAGADGNGGEEYIVNGDIGFVNEIKPKDLIVTFIDPDRQVVIPKKDKHLLHAYCITCHRFQGSEAPVIIIPVHKQFNMFLSNSWIYTAISRGKEIVITVGAFNTITKAIRNRKPNDRHTKLTGFLAQIQQERRQLEYGI
jgi:exodeoxyribonuclease V alpha subunit